VINSRMRGRRLQYLVRWKGYGHEENSWSLEGDLNALGLVAEFHEGHPTTLKQINALMFESMGFRPQLCT
jgi:hypothetical protein